MKGILEKLKRITLEPKMYSLVARGPKLVILHLGIHFHLEAAFAAVKQRAMKETGITDPSKLNLEMLMWESMPASSVLSGFFGKGFQTQVLPLTEDGIDISQLIKAELSTTEYARQVYGMKNELMKRIIDKKDLVALKESGAILSKAEFKFIHGKIIANEQDTEVKGV